MAWYKNFSDNVLIEQNITDNSELLSYVNEETYLVYYPEIDANNKLNFLFQLKTKSYYDKFGTGFILAKDVTNILKNYKTAKTIRKHLYPILTEYQNKVANLNNEYQRIYNQTHKLQDLIRKNDFFNLLHEISKKGSLLEPLKSQFFSNQEIYLEEQILKKLKKQLNQTNCHLDTNSINTNCISYLVYSAKQPVLATELATGKSYITEKIYSKLINDNLDFQDNTENLKSLEKLINDTFDKGETYFLKALYEYLNDNTKPMFNLLHSDVFNQNSKYVFKLNSENASILDNKFKSILQKIENNKQHILLLFNIKNQNIVFENQTPTTLFTDIDNFCKKNNLDTSLILGKDNQFIQLTKGTVKILTFNINKEFTDYLMTDFYPKFKLHDFSNDDEFSKVCKNIN